MPTVAQSLDKANPNELADLLRTVKLGTALANLRPRETARTGLASSATQVHPYPAAILAVNSTDGTPLAFSINAAPDSGEVRVNYDADGIPTLVFNAAVTAYRVYEMPYGIAPATGQLGLADLLASTWSGCV
jgi:hypothetical protein